MERALSLISGGQCNHYNSCIEAMDSAFTKESNIERTMKHFMQTENPSEIIKHILDPISFELDVFRVEYHRKLEEIEHECRNGYSSEVAHTAGEF